VSVPCEEEEEEDAVVAAVDLPPSIGKARAPDTRTSLLCG